MVEQLVRFLGVSYDKAQLESMVEHCHQLIDQCCNAEALPVGRGMFKTHSKNLKSLKNLQDMLRCWQNVDT